MAPTISAASKITPPPRKRPLIERNDPARTSISFSDPKPMFFSNASEDFDVECDTNQKIPSSSEFNSMDSRKKVAFQEALLLPKPSKKVTLSDVAQESISDSVVTASDCPRMESLPPNKHVSCSPLPTPIALLDADPSMPPYDPKTNFLSPRPRFRYYKPNSRFDILLDKENGVGGPVDFEQMEDNFVSENATENSSSDSEGTEVSDNDSAIGLASPEVDDLVGDSRDSEETLEVIASTELIDLECMEVVDGKNTEKENLEGDYFLNKKSNFVGKGKKNHRRISRYVCFSMVAMVLLMATCMPLSTMRCALFEEFVRTKASSFFNQSRAETSSNETVLLDRVMRRVDQLSVYSIAFITKVAGGGELGKRETQMAPVKYMNLSGLQTDSWGGEHFRTRNEVDETFVEIVEDDDELHEELNAETEAYEEDDDSIENLEEPVDTQKDDMLETENIPSDSSNSDFEYSEDIVHNVIPADQSASIILHDQESQVEAEVEEVVLPETMELEKFDDEATDDVNSLAEGVVQRSITPERSFLAHYNGIGITSIVAALSAFAACFYHYRRNHSPNSANVVLANNNSSIKRPDKAFFSSHNWKIEAADDVMGMSSCPSEMSGFQKIPPFCNNSKARKQHPSKRESLTTSSSSSEFNMGSPSYGSFTTFEKIPVKNVNGEEEIITPVRRSSRIKNHQPVFTSP